MKGQNGCNKKVAMLMYQILIGIVFLISTFRVKYQSTYFIHGKKS